MITYYYKQPRDETFVKKLTYSDGDWVYVEAPNKQELSGVCEHFKLNQQIVLQVQDNNTVPHVEKVGEYGYVFVRFPLSIDGSLTTAPMLFVIGKGAFLTISQYRVESCQKLVTKVSDYSTADHNELGLAIFNEIIKQYGTYVNQIGSKIEGIRSRLKGQTIGNKDFVDFVLIEGVLNEFVTVMRSTSVTLRSMTRAVHRKTVDEYNDIIKEIINNSQQSVDSCDLYAKSIVSIRDAYSTINSNSLNQTMKFLTIATLFVALPNCIYGMYGMNVPLPMQDKPWAYPLLFVISILMPVGVMVWAKKQKLL